LVWGEDAYLVVFFYTFIEDYNHQHSNYDKNISEVEGGPEIERDEICDGAYR
jgi:hypothetical protein